LLANDIFMMDGRSFRNKMFTFAGRRIRRQAV